MRSLDGLRRQPKVNVESALFGGVLADGPKAIARCSQTTIGFAVLALIWAFFAPKVPKAILVCSQWGIGFGLGFSLESRQPAHFTSKERGKRKPNLPQKDLNASSENRTQLNSGAGDISKSNNNSKTIILKALLITKRY